METRDHTFSIVSQEMQFPQKISRLLNSPYFSPKVFEILNLGTNPPKVRTLRNNSNFNALRNTCRVSTA